MPANPGVTDPHQLALSAAIGRRRALGAVRDGRRAARYDPRFTGEEQGIRADLGGVRLGTNEIITLAADQRLHMRTDGPCLWGSIRLPAGEQVGMAAC